MIPEEPKVTLDHIVKDLLSFYNGFECLHEAKGELEKKCDIKKEPEHKCWSEDYIKKAWKETIKEDIKSSRRKYWACVIMLQIVKSFFCNTCKQNTAQKNRHAATDEQDCDMRRNPEDSSSRSKALSQTCTPNSKRKHRDTSFFSDDQSRTEDNAGSKEETKGLKEHKTIYIRIPFSEMFQSEANKPHKLPQKTDKRKVSKYKLIDLPPQDVKQFTEADQTIDEKGKRRFYVMSYNNETKTPKWVYEILNISTLPSYYKKQEFKYSDSDSDDPSYTPTKFSKPFENSDYDRGHLAAAANHTWCQDAYEETFSMRNVTPQNKTLNRGLWKRLEEYCRKKVLIDEVHNVHVYTGALYKGKAVPSDYFKVVIVEKEGGEVEMECYKMPNENPESEEQDKNLNLNKTRRNSEANNDWLKKYKVDITEIEENSGLKFTEDCCELDGVDQEKSGKWLGNNGKKSVTIDVTISSCKKNDPSRHEE